MSAPSYANILTGLADQIDEVTHHFVEGGYQALSQALAKPLASMCILYIILVGYGMIRGLITTPLQEFIKGVLRIGFIYQLAMDWSFFASYCVTWFTTGMSELGTVMMQLMPESLHYPSKTVNEGLQAVLNEVVQAGSAVWNTATVRHPGPVFCALMIYAGGMAVVALAFFELVAAKFMLSLCLCTAPLFVLCTLFDKTRNFFDQWLGRVIGFSLVIFFVSTVVGFCMHLVHWCLGAYVDKQAAYVAVGWIPLFLCACLCVMSLLEIVGLAKSIGGSCSTGTGSAMVGGFISGSMSALSVGGLSRHMWGLSKSLKERTFKTPADFDSPKPSDISGAMQAIQDRMRGQQ
jgi:type IV secretion system protein VirB6